jgi:hypothetical protein
VLRVVTVLYGIILVVCKTVDQCPVHPPDLLMDALLLESLTERLSLLFYRSSVTENRTQKLF